MQLIAGLRLAARLRAALWPVWHWHGAVLRPWRSERSTVL